MKNSILISLTLSLVGSLTAGDDKASCATACETACAAATTVADKSSPVIPTAPTPAAEEGVGKPLKGVIIDLLPKRSALLVKHEEIPGVMAAMTMALKVDADTLATAKKGQIVTGLILKKSDGWWLLEAKTEDAAK